MLKRTFLSFVVILGTAVLGTAKTANPSAKPLAEQVRHELVMLPYYNVFDNLQFRVDAGTVELSGQVTDPVLRASAENVVKHLPGVTRVENRIEVLPLSPMDNRIRLAAYRAIYSWPSLNRLASMPVPPVHIIVKNGNITLEGIAPTLMDKQVAYLRASSVPLVFTVTNNLVVEGQPQALPPTR
jgi:hyperosmotically inducible protein